MTDQRMPPESPQTYRDDKQDSSQGTAEPEPWPEPEPDRGNWPDWTQHQQTNWITSVKPLYDNLKTEPGRFWFRRTWRPKKKRTGTILRNHVELSTPEWFIKRKVDSAINDDVGQKKSAIRGVGTIGYDMDNINLAIDDNVQARVAMMDPAERQSLPDEAKQTARTFDITIPEGTNA